MQSSFTLVPRPRQWRASLRRTIYAPAVLRWSVRWGALWVLAACGPAPAPRAAAAPVAEPEPPPVDWRADPALEDVVPAASSGARVAGPELVFQSVARNNVVDASFVAGGAVVTIGGDGEASLVDLTTGRVRASRRVFVRRAVRSLEVSRRGVAYVLNGTSFGTTGGVRTWDLRSGCLREVRLGGLGYIDAQSAALDPRSERLALIHSQEGAPGLWLQDERGHGSSLPLDTLAFPTFTPSGRLLLRLVDGRLQLRGFDDEAEPLLELSAGPQEGDAVRVAVDPKGRAIYTSSTGAALTWRDPLDGSAMAEVALESATQLRHLDVSGDGERLGLVRADGTIELRASRDGRELGTTALPEGWEQALEGVADLHLDHAGDRALYRAGQMLVAVPLRTPGVEPAEPSEMVVRDYTMALELSADGRWLAIVGRSLTLVDLGVAELEPALRFEPEGGEHSVWGVAWAPDDAGLVSYGRGGVESWGRGGIRSSGCRGAGVVVWGESPALHVGSERCDLATGQRVEMPPALATSADGSRLLVDRGTHLEVVDAAGDGAGRVRKPRGTAVCRFGECVARHALDADGSVLAHGSPRDVDVQDARGRPLGHLGLAEAEGRGRRPAALPRRRVRCSRSTAPAEGRSPSVECAGWSSWRPSRRPSPQHVSFAPDSESLAVANGAELTILAADGSTIASREGTEPIVSLAFTADGQALVVRSAESLQVLDRDGAARAARSAIGVPWAVSSDGETVVQCENGTLIASDLLTRESRPLGDCMASDDLTISPSGRYVAARRGSFIEVHRLSDGAAIALHAPRVDENLALTSHPYAVDGSGAYELGAGGRPGAVPLPASRAHARGGPRPSRPGAGDGTPGGRLLRGAGALANRWSVKG